MATRDDIRRIASTLPEAVVDDDASHVTLEGKGILWPWLERVHPNRARVPSDAVVAIRLATEMDKPVLIEMAPDVFFTEPHYDGYPAILVRLAAIDPELLAELLTNAWRARAPRRLRGGRPGTTPRPVA